MLKSLLIAQKLPQFEQDKITVKFVSLHGLLETLSLAKLEKQNKVLKIISFLKHKTSKT